MDLLEIRLLGEPSCTLGGKPWPVRGLRRAFEVVALCALARGRPIARETAAAQLWPDVDREDARANLRRHLSRLRELFPAHCYPIACDHRAIRWNDAAHVWVDVIEFERLSANAQSQDAAMAIYHGDLLEGVDEDWVFGHRERLRSSAVGISYRLATQALASGDYAPARDHAQRTLDLGEWREDALRVLMKALYGTGDRLGALAAYDRFAQMLLADVGVKPMTETVALREAIVADVPLPPTPAQGAAHRTVGAHPLVGRENELERLLADWDRAKRRAGTTVFIGGEAGIGKTRLTSALAAAVSDDEGSVFFGHAPPDGSSAYQPLVDVMRAVLPFVAQSVEDRCLHALVDIVPEVASLRPSLQSSDAAPLTTERLHHAFASVLEAAAALRPLLIVLEDLHWADRETLDAVAYLARRMRGMRALVVITHRSEETPLAHPLRALRRRLIAEHRASIVPLVPLDAAAVHAIAAQFLPEAERASSAREALHATGGNPLFVLQYFRDRLEGGDGSQAAGESVENVIAARLARLPSEARTLFAIAALIDVRFTIEELAEVSGSDEAAVQQAVDVLLDRHYVRWWSQPNFALTFAHDLLRQGALAGDGAKNAPLHRRIARTLETTRTLDRSTQLLIARHYELAGEAAEAYARYSSIANAAVSVAPAFAIETARAAHRVAAGDAERFEALEIAARAHAVVGGATEPYENDIAAMAELAQRLDDAKRFAVLLHEADFCSRQSDTTRMHEVAERLLALAQESGKADQLARAYEERGRCKIQVGDLRDGIKEYQNSIAFSEAGTLDEFRRRAYLVNCIARLGDSERAKALFSELEIQLASISDPRAELWLGIAHQILAIVLEQTDVFEAAGNRLVTASDRVGAMATRVVGLSLLAQAAFRRLEVEKGRALVREVFEAIDRYDIMINSIAMGNNLTLAEREIGNIDYAIEAWERSHDAAQRAHLSSAMVCALINGAEAKLERGEAHASVAMARRALDLTRRSGERRLLIDGEVTLGEALVATGRRAEGLTLLRRVVEEREITGSMRSLSNDLSILIESLVDAGETADLARYAERLKQLYALGRDRVTFPSRVCGALALAAAALGDTAAAARYRFEGRTIVRQILEKLPDDGTRAGFATMRFNRRLMESDDQKVAVDLNNR